MAWPSLTLPARNRRWCLGQTIPQPKPRVIENLQLNKSGEDKDHLDRASTSIPLNIAEGNGKYSPKDRARFFDIANGSAFECAAGLDVLIAKGKLMPEEIVPGKERLLRIVRMLVGLLKGLTDRSYPLEKKEPLSV